MSNWYKMKAIKRKNSSKPELATVSKLHLVIIENHCLKTAPEKIQH